jgi:hypothetical protein
MDDEIKLPRPDPELEKDEAYKEMENSFVAEMFDNERLNRNKPETKPDLNLDEIFKEEPAAAEPKKDETPEAKLAETPKEEKKADPKPATDALVADSDPKPEETPAEPEVEKPAAAAPVIDPDDLADRVADRLRPKPEPKPTPAPDPLATYSEEDREELRALSILNKNGKYTGRDLVKETTEFWNRETEYMAKWRRENPGKKFNPDDEEHADFYDANQPDIPEKDINDAHITLRAQEIAAKEVDRKIKEEMEPLRKKITETEREALEQKVKPVIAQAVSQSVAAMAVAAVPEFSEIIKDGRLTQEAVDAMNEKDPAAVHAINDEARALRVRVEELERMAQMPNHFRFDERLSVPLKGGEVIRPHAEIMDAAHAVEDSILRGPREGRVRDGRQFIPTGVFNAKMDEAQKAGNQALIDRLLNNFWIIGPEDIKQAFVARSAEKVKRILEIANARGNRPAGNPAPKTGTTPATKPAEAPAKKASTPPPSTASASDITDTRIPKAPAAEPQHKIVEKSFFG